MAKEATLQVRMDADVKQAAEELYRSLGTSLAEAIRMFAQKSIDYGGIPFPVKKEGGSQENITIGNRSLQAMQKAQAMFEGAADKLGVANEEDVQKLVDEVRYGGCK